MRNENENPGRARWLRPALLLLLFVAMPFGLASAQSPDMGAVTARLRQAIRSGELNADQARVMLEALRRSVAQPADVGAGKKAAAVAKSDVDWANVRRRLGAAVERGDMTREEAGKKLAALRQQAVQKAKRGAAKKAAAVAKSDVDWTNVRRRLAAAVERGDMTREEAGKKLAALRQQAAQKAKRGAAKKAAAAAKSDVDWTNVRRRLAAAVEAGKMTTEQARQKLTELRQQTARKQAAQKGGRRREY